MREKRKKKKRKELQTFSTMSDLTILGFRLGSARYLGFFLKHRISEARKFNLMRDSIQTELVSLYKVINSG